MKFRSLGFGCLLQLAALRSALIGYHAESIELQFDESQLSVIESWSRRVLLSVNDVNRYIAALRSDDVGMVDAIEWRA